MFQDAYSKLVLMLLHPMDNGIARSIVIQLSLTRILHLYREELHTPKYTCTLFLKCYSTSGKIDLSVKVFCQYSPIIAASISIVHNNCASTTHMWTQMPCIH